MNRKQSRPQRLGRVCLCVELEVPLSGPLSTIALVNSLPGRPGTFTRTWDLPSSGLTEAVWKDIQSVLLESVHSALVLLGGAQQELPV